MDIKQSFEENFPLYFQISKDSIVIHLTEHYGDCILGARIRIRVKELEKFHGRLKEYRYNKPGIEKMEWGTMEMSLLDPIRQSCYFCGRPESIMTDLFPLINPLFFVTYMYEKA
jgi:hypothetical protein